MSARKIQIPSIYTRDSSFSSKRPGSSISSISTQRSVHPSVQPTRAPTTATPAAPTAGPTAAPAAPSPATPATGLLVLITAGTPNASLKSYVKTALTKGSSITEIVVLGEQKHEQALKQLKVEMYGLAGAMKRELGVNVEYGQAPLSEEEIRQHLTKVLDRTGRKELHGVLIDLSEEEMQPMDVLEVEPQVLMGQWLRSVGFVHAVARCTIPLLRVAAHRASQAVPMPEKALKCPFFVTTLRSSSGTSGGMHIVALRSLLDSLSTLGNRDITFGEADVLLAPEPEPVVQERQTAIAPTN